MKNDARNTLELFCAKNSRCYGMCQVHIGFAREIWVILDPSFVAFVFFFSFPFVIFVWESLSCNVICCILIRRTLSLGSCAAALDEKYVSTYFLATYRGVFLVVFRICRSTVSIS